MGWTRIAVAGVGARGEWWARAISRRLGGKVAIAALCDRNPGRSRRLADLLAASGPRPALYDDCRRMLEEVRPDALLVAVPDHQHAQLVCLAMGMGIDVLLEKPIAC